MRHKSHETLELINLTRENDIILLSLPPHTTHNLQPLDLILQDLKRDFAKTPQAFSISNIKSGFKKCGIFPTDRNAIDMSKLLPSEMYTSEESTDTALSLISHEEVSSLLAISLVATGLKAWQTF